MPYACKIYVTQGWVFFHTSERRKFCQYRCECRQGLSVMGQFLSASQSLPNQCSMPHHQSCHWSPSLHRQFLFVCIAVQNACTSGTLGTFAQCWTISVHMSMSTPPTQPSGRSVGDTFWRSFSALPDLLLCFPLMVIILHILLRDTLTWFSSSPPYTQPASAVLPVALLHRFARLFLKSAVHRL